MKKLQFYHATSLLMILTMSGCESGCKTSHVNPPVIVNRPAFYIINKVGRIVINAKCYPGEQMIGGGYSFPTFEINRVHFRKESEMSPQEIFDGTNIFADNATPCDKNQNPLIIEASYPSAIDTWTVIIYNPDIADNCYNSGNMIEVDCYAISSPIIKLHMKISSTIPQQVINPNGPEILTDEIDCSPGSIVTAGGFKLEPSDDKMWSGRESPLWGSYPKINSSNKAIGWVSDYYSKSPYQAKISTYVLYSTPGNTIWRILGITDGSPSTLQNPLIDGPVKQDVISYNSKTNYFYGDVKCDPGYFSPGGGFKRVYTNQFSTSPNGPFNQNSAKFIVNGQPEMFTGWTWEGFYYPYANSTDNVYTIQIQNLPPNLDVQITNPTENSFLGEDPSKKGFTIPISFKGKAYDHDGTLIPNDRLYWEIKNGPSGNPTGPMSEFTASIDLNKGEAITGTNRSRFLVKLTATSNNGDKVTASIWLYWEPM